MDAKGKCQHCDQPLTFDAAMAGTDIDCPSCGGLTRLFLPVAANQKPAPRPVSALSRKPAPLIEDELTSLGTNLFWIGGFLGICCFLVAVVCFYQEYISSALSAFLAGLGNIGGGFIIRCLFHGLAEIIRLLRGIKAKP